jgi:hypothetical protein
MGDVDSYFQQVNPSTELLTNSMGQTTFGGVASRSLSPEILHFLTFYIGITETFHCCLSWDSWMLLYRLTAYFIAPILTL